MENFFAHITRSKRKTLTISIPSPNEILVKAPQNCSESTIEAFIKSHIEWIKIHLELKKKKEELPPFTLEEKRQFAKQTKELLEQKLPYYAKKLGVKYNKVTVKIIKTKWGSCSTAKNLNFNAVLSQTPEYVFDGVVCHELCHLKQMNHQKKFYNLLYNLYPDYQKCEEWLKNEGKVLISRMREKTNKN